MWVRNGMTLGTKWYGLGYEMVWDESAWVRNDLIPVYGTRAHGYEMT